MSIDVISNDSKQFYQAKKKNFEKHGREYVCVLRQNFSKTEESSLFLSLENLLLDKKFFFFGETSLKKMFFFNHT